MALVTDFSMRMAMEQQLAGRRDANVVEEGVGTGTRWLRAAPVSAFPEDGGACVKVGSLQIAVFNFARRGEWFACQNLCPHRHEFVLSRGMLGSARGTPKVACPLHKATFSLESGECLNSDLDCLRIYPVRVEDGWILIELAADDLE